VIDDTFVVGVGEVLKITLVERLFQVGRAKLMTIPAFARELRVRDVLAGLS
jgi:hypothetical protein